MFYFATLLHLMVWWLVCPFPVLEAKFWWQVPDFISGGAAAGGPVQSLPPWGTLSRQLLSWAVSRETPYKGEHSKNSWGFSAGTKHNHCQDATKKGIMATQGWYPASTNFWRKGLCLFLTLVTTTFTLRIQILWPFSKFLTVLENPALSSMRQTQSPLWKARLVTSCVSQQNKPPSTLHVLLHCTVSVLNRFLFPYPQPMQACISLILADLAKHIACQKQELSKYFLNEWTGTTFANGI